MVPDSSPCVMWIRRNGHVPREHPSLLIYHTQERLVSNYNPTHPLIRRAIPQCSYVNSRSASVSDESATGRTTQIIEESIPLEHALPKPDPPKQDFGAQMWMGRTPMDGHDPSTESTPDPNAYADAENVPKTTSMEALPFFCEKEHRALRSEPGSPRTDVEGQIDCACRNFPSPCPPPAGSWSQTSRLLHSRAFSDGTSETATLRKPSVLSLLDDCAAPSPCIEQREASQDVSFYASKFIILRRGHKLQGLRPRWYAVTRVTAPTAALETLSITGTWTFQAEVDEARCKADQRRGISLRSDTHPNYTEAEMLVKLKRPKAEEMQFGQRLTRRRTSCRGNQLLL